MKELSALQAQVENGNQVEKKPTRGKDMDEFKWDATYKAWAYREALKDTPKKLA